MITGDVLKAYEVEWLTEGCTRDGGLTLEGKELVADLRETALEMNPRFKGWMTREMSNIGVGKTSIAIRRQSVDDPVLSIELSNLVRIPNIGLRSTH